LIDFFLSAQKTIASAKGGQKRKKQNTKLGIQNSEYNKHKNQSHNKIHSARGGKILFNRLFDWDLLVLKPCPTGRYAFIY
jgi:hypothetical protein